MCGGGDTEMPFTSRKLGKVPEKAGHWSPVLESEVWKSQIIAQPARKAWWESKVPGCRGAG